MIREKMKEAKGVERPCIMFILLCELWSLMMGPELATPIQNGRTGLTREVKRHLKGTP